MLILMWAEMVKIRHQRHNKSMFYCQGTQEKMLVNDVIGLNYCFGTEKLITHVKHFSGS